MAWQPEVGSGTARATSYRDFVTKLVGFCTSQRVATVAVNAAGSGYVTGDVVTLTHAGALLNARFEVTAAAGAITALRIIASGAFSNRLSGSVTVNAGGTGYTASVSNIILEVQGGTSREKAKVQATTNGSGVVTSATRIETSGSYSSVPSFPATTSVIGPSGTAAGTGCTITTSTTGLIGTTGLAVTGGTGTGATVNITLAQIGWAIATTNKNNRVWNSLLDEKEVVLVGDAAGNTNKPYIGFRTGTETVGVNTRYFVAIYGFTAYNPSLSFAAQAGESPGLDSSDNHTDTGPYLIFPQDLVNDTDFWFSADDIRVTGATNVNPAAATDDGRYQNFYAGYHDRVKTETEDPYPMLVGASSSLHSANPTAANTAITSIAECRTTNPAQWWYYRTEAGAWTAIINDTGGSVGGVQNAMWPCGANFLNGIDPEIVVTTGPTPLTDSVIKRDRSAPDRNLRMVPGTTPKHLTYALVILRKVSDPVSDTTDSIRGTVRGVVWVYNADSAGAAINDFSKDYVVIGSARYRVFHNWTLTERYQYVAFLEDV